MAGLVYYQKQPFLKKRWQRMGLAIALVTTATLIGNYFELLVEKRYSSFKGRTALYGDSTVRNGWLVPHDSDQHTSK